MKALLSNLVLIVLLGCATPSRAEDNRIPPAVEQALRQPEKVVFYSLEPWDAKKNPNRWHGFTVLGKVELKQKQAAPVIEEFKQAVDRWDNAMASCFDPRHAIQVTSAGHTYDLLLCYACHQLCVYEGEKLLADIGAFGSRKKLDGILRSLNVPVSQTDTDEEREAQAKKQKASEARWHEAMPRSIRSLWTKEIENAISADPAKFRAALVKEFPNARQRCLALFTWFGSGDGPWSGFPSYESVAEELLLDIPTPELIAAAEMPDLSEVQLEGAARLFGGWDFSHRRPDDLKLLSPGLKKKLLEHSLKDTNKDKLERARHAFAT